MVKVLLSEMKVDECKKLFSSVSCVDENNPSFNEIGELWKHT